MRRAGIILLTLIAVAIVVGVFLGADRGRDPDRPREPDADGAPDAEPPLVTAATTPTEVPPGWRTIRGLVLDAESLAPIEGARVRIYRGWGSTEATTDERGEWRHPLPRFGTGDTWALVSARGYTNEWVDVPMNPRCRTIADAPPAFLMKASVEVWGTLVGADGRPIAGVRVRCNGSVGSVPTDATGRFGPILTAPGSIHLQAFSDRGLDWTQTATVPHGSPRFEVTIRVPAPRHARGITVDEAGAPLPGVLVAVSGYGEVPGLRSDADGRFEWPLLAPEVTVEATKEGYVCRGGEFVLNHRTETRIVFERAASVSGRVVTADGAPLPPGLVIRSGRCSCELGPDGTYRLGPLAATGAELRVGYDRPVRFRRNEWDAVLCYSDPELAIGEDRTDHVIRLPRLVALEGRVIDAETGAPVAGAFVDHLVTDEAGRYFFPVTEKEAAKPEVWLDVEATGYLPTRTWHSDGNAIAVRRARPIDVEVRDESGAPVPAVAVSVRGPARWSGVTDPEGRCRVWAARGEAADVWCSPHRRIPILVTVPPGQTEVVVVSGPRKEAWFVLLARDESDQPLPNAWLEFEGRRVPADAAGRLSVVESDEEIRVGAPGREVRVVESRPEGGEGVYVLREAAPVRARFQYADGRPITGLPVHIGRTDTMTDADGRVEVGSHARGTTVGLKYHVEGWERRSASAVAGGDEVLIRLASRGEIFVRFVADDAANGKRSVCLFRRSKFFKWILCFQEEGRGGLRLSVEEGVVSLCFRIAPGAYRYYGDLRVAAGKPVVVDYDFPRPGRITGTVTGPEGKPLEHADIRLWELGLIRVFRTDGEGRFALDLDATRPETALGPIRLLVTHHDCAPTLTEPIDLERDQALSISLTRGGSLRGRVVGIEGESEVRFVARDAARSTKCWTREDGTFEKGSVRAGRHRLRIRTSDGKTFYRDVEIVEGEETVVTFRPD